MFQSGLCSITFRHLPAQEIAVLAGKATIDVIEWGGDIHVPHGNVKVAREVRRMTLDAGCNPRSYGSYFHVGADAPDAFQPLVDTAVALGAANIRVWAGKQGSRDADAAYRDCVVTASQAIADMAAQAGLTISYEFHSNTLTDTSASAVDLLQRVDRRNVRCYWQPVMESALDAGAADLRAVLPWLSNIHAYCWLPGGERRPLEEGEADWVAYLGIAADAPGDRAVLLEYVRNDDPVAFLRDAITLKIWLSCDLRRPAPTDGAAPTQRT